MTRCAVTSVRPARTTSIGSSTVQRNCMATVKSWAPEELIGTLIVAKWSLDMSTTLTLSPYSTCGSSPRSRRSPSTNVPSYSNTSRWWGSWRGRLEIRRRGLLRNPCLATGSSGIWLITG
ncbi:hypothetical protein C1I98_30340 [Spongiactinospora gelatinilytica]|uniref:Uncharacterized protein n=1 Tax=Spongiactinospora gelatinilytica TaxID=2666298 RepID=A0A2W2G1C0_9ACTN|nr:hypothetical protein C1I98_30340 [Spongiactinospora gelatinilytica]